MSHRDWLESARAAARLRGLPEEYVARLIEELAAHAEDLAADGAPPERHLGAPESVAEAAAESYRAGSFAGRHPAVALLLLPALALVLSWAGYTLVGDLILESLCLLLGNGHSAVFYATAAAAWLPGFLLAALIVPRLRWACRRSAQQAWYWAGCAAVALLAGLLVSECRWPAPEACPALFVEIRLQATWLQAAQGLFPLALAAALSR